MRRVRPRAWTVERDQTGFVRAGSRGRNPKGSAHLSVASAKEENPYIRQSASRERRLTGFVVRIGDVYVDGSASNERSLNEFLMPTELLTRRAGKRERRVETQKFSPLTDDPALVSLSR